MEAAGERAQLGDGTELVLRPIRLDDAPKLIALHGRLSPESVYLRFLGPRPTLPPEEARRLATVDYDRTMAIVATQPRGDDEAIVGVARYAAVRPDSIEEAEAAVVVEDSFQGRGLGTILMRRLIGHAQSRGVATLSAEITAGNERMLRFIRRSGLPFSQRLEGGSWQIRADIAYNGP
jgi:RimJ/RimL family protein N-acetyltransferase